MDDPQFDDDDDGRSSVSSANLSDVSTESGSVPKACDLARLGIHLVLPVDVDPMLLEIELDAAFLCATQNRDQVVLHRLLYCSEGARSVFKRFCLEKPWGTDDFPLPDLEWVCFNLLKWDAVLALDVVEEWDCLKFLTTIFRCRQLGDRTLSRIAHHLCLLKPGMFTEVVESIRFVEKSQLRYFLFLVAVRNGHFSAARYLFGSGITMEDLYYAIGMGLLDTCHCHTVLSFSIKVSKCLLEQVIFLSKRHRSVMKRALADLFSGNFSTPKKNIFICLFDLYCNNGQRSPRFTVSVFRQAIEAAFKSNDAVFFMLCCKFMVQYCLGIQQDFSVAIADSSDADHTELLTHPLHSYVLAAVGSAIDKHKFDFVLLACHCSVMKLVGVSDFSVSTSFQKDRRIFAELLNRGFLEQGCCLQTHLGTLSQFLSCLNLVGKQFRSRRKKVAVDGAAVLEKWLQDMYSIGQLMNMKKDSYDNHTLSPVVNQLCVHSRAFVQWCSRHKFANLALIVAAAKGERQLLENLFALHGDSIATSLLVAVGRLFLSQDSWWLLAVVLEHTPVNETTCMFLLPQLQGQPSTTESVLAMLECRLVYGWVLAIHVKLSQWLLVWEKHARCKDQAALNFALDRAVRTGHVDLVCQLASVRSDPVLLMKALRFAVTHAAPVAVGALVNLVDIAPDAESLKTFCFVPLKDPSLLQAACECLPTMQKDRYKVIECLIRAGVSTYQQAGEPSLGVMASPAYICPTAVACACGALGLVKLFYLSGVCSNRRLRSLIGFVAMTRVQVDRVAGNYKWYVPAIEAVRQYLSTAASTPHSLHNLSRLALSHSLGTQPGRPERIQALALPPKLKKFLDFQDLNLYAAVPVSGGFLPSLPT